MTSIFICVCCAVAAWLRPALFGWLALGSYVFFLEVGYLVLVFHPTVPLRSAQVFFSIAIGVALSPSNLGKLRNATFDKSIAVLIIFFALETLTGFRQADVTLYKYFFLHQYPQFFAVIVLSFYLIHNKNDLVKAWALLLSGIVAHALLVIIELSTGFNFAHFSCSLAPQSCHIDQLHWATEGMKEGVYNWSKPSSFFSRYIGATGSPNKTAIFIGLGLCLFLYAACILYNKKIHQLMRMSGFLTAVIVGVALALILLISQVRAAIGALAVTWAGLAFFERKVRFLLLSVITAVAVVIFVYEPLHDYLFLAAANRLSEVEVFGQGERTQAVQSAWVLFTQQWHLGYGGTIFWVSDTLLGSKDMTAFGLYFVAGGLLLGSVYIFVWYQLLSDLICLRSKTHCSEHRFLILLSIGGIVFIMLTQLFNENAVFLYVVALFSMTKASLRSSQ